VKRIVIDTNVAVSFLADRDLRQQELAARLFQDAAPEILLHQTVISELVYMLRNLYKQTPQDVAEITRELSEMPGVSVMDEMPWGDLFSIWPCDIETYADAALAVVAGSRKDSYLATFDRNFEKGLRRLGIRTQKPGD
jgi:predicted nucleic acid-binding protein